MSKSIKYGLVVLALLVIACEVKKNKITDLGEGVEDQYKNQLAYVVSYPDTVFGETDAGGQIITIFHDEELKEVQTFTRKGRRIDQWFSRNHMQDSLSSMWYINGQKIYENRYKEGHREGWSFHWFEDGSLRSEWFYKDDKMIHGKNVILDNEGLIDYIEILQYDEVIETDRSLHGKPADRFKGDGFVN